MRCLAVDVGGSGLRVTWAGEAPGPVGRSGECGSADGDRLGRPRRARPVARRRGRRRTGRRGGRLVWSTRGLMLQDPGPLREMLARAPLRARRDRQRRRRLARRCSRSGRAGRGRPPPAQGAVAFATDLDATWRRVGRLGARARRRGLLGMARAGRDACGAACGRRPAGGSRALLDAARELCSGTPRPGTRQTMTGPTPRRCSARWRRPSRLRRTGVTRSRPSCAPGPAPRSPARSSTPAAGLPGRAPHGCGRAARRRPGPRRPRGGGGASRTGSCDRPPVTPSTGRGCSPLRWRSTSCRTTRRTCAPRATPPASGGTIGVVDGRRGPRGRPGCAAAILVATAALGATASAGRAVEDVPWTGQTCEAASSAGTR